LSFGILNDHVKTNYEPKNQGSRSGVLLKICFKASALSTLASTVNNRNLLKYFQPLNNHELLDTE